nr:toxin C-terminal domain-containing protein [Pseudomonas lundensis]
MEWVDALGLAYCKCTSKDEKTRLAPELVFKTNKKAAKPAEIWGFKEINEKIHGGQAVFKLVKGYIARDLDGHNG